MKVSLRTIRKMVKASSLMNAPIILNMKDNSKIIKRMDMVCINLEIEVIKVFL